MTASEQPSQRVERLIRQYRVSLGRIQMHRKPRILNVFVEYIRLNEQQIEKLTYRDMEKFIAFLLQAGLTQAQVAQEFSILRKFYDYLCAEGILSVNLARDVFARGGKIEPRTYTDKELIRICRTHHPRI